MGNVIGRGRVLLGFGEAVAGPEAVWSLRDARFEPVLFHRRGARPSARRCHGVSAYEVTPPERSVEACGGDLVAVAQHVGAIAALPLDDASLWLLNRVRDRLPCPLAAPGPEAVHVALDKRAQLEAADRAGLPSPETAIVRSAAEATRSGVGFPLILKSSNVITERDDRLARGEAHFCANEKDVERAFGLQEGKRRYLAQPLIRGVGEGLFGYMDQDGQAHAWSAHRRVRMMNPQGSGSSACRSASPDPSLLEPAERMLRSVGWRGLFMLEMLRDEFGAAWLMELNGRVWGSTALARRMGFEYPAWAVEQSLDESFLPVPPERVGEIVARHMGRELVRALLVLRGSKGPSGQAWPGRLEALHDALRFGRSDAFYNNRRGERLVFMSDTIGTVLSNTLQRRRG